MERQLFLPRDSKMGANHEALHLRVVKMLRRRLPRIRLDERRVERPEDSAPEIGPPAVASCEQRVAAGRTHAGGRVGIGEAHALRSEAIEIGRRDL